MYWRYLRKTSRSIFSARVSDKRRRFQKITWGGVLFIKTFPLLSKGLKESDHQLSLSDENIHIQQYYRSRTEVKAGCRLRDVVVFAERLIVECWGRLVFCVLLRD